MIIKTPSWGLVLIVICTFLKLTSANAQNLTLTPSDYNGFNISCFGKQDGSINLTITGGTPPYNIRWSNNEVTEDISSLRAGYYKVDVDDSDSITGPVSAEITLTEPLNLRTETTIHKYNNDYNISVYGGCNGIISFIVNGGVAPYSYLWSDNNTSNSRSNLCAADYAYRVTDNNGCHYGSERYSLSQPERSDWQMGGNSNIDPNVQYIGTSDSTDFVFRTNSAERLRIKANGNINFSDNLNVGNLINFANNGFIDYTDATAVNPITMSFGKKINPSLIGVLCSPTQATAYYQFEGLIQSYGNASSGGNLNMMQLGFDGENSVIDAAGDNSGTGNHRLLLNYNCGKDVFIGNPTIGGNLTANNNFYSLGNAGIGTTDASVYRLNVNGDLNFSGDLYRDGILMTGGLWNVNNTGIHYVDGNVGIGLGSVDPTSKLEVAGNVLLLSHHGDKNNALEFLSNNGIPHKRGFSIGPDTGNPGEMNGSFNFWIHQYQNDPSGTSRFNFKEGLENKTLMSISSNGQVAINSAPEPGYKLTVCGGIFSTKVKVIATWCDFVFADDYKLRSLEDVEKYIDENNHLPDVPSAIEIESSGLDLGELVKIQMLKIEEITLYLIQLKKENDMLKTQIQTLNVQKK